MVGTVNAASGSLDQAFAFSPFGEAPAGASPTGEPFRFTGRYLDAETGLYYYRARYYDPKTGRFLQADPIGSKDDPNLYQYGLWDPLDKTDPSGLEACYNAAICAEQIAFQQTVDKISNANAPFAAAALAPVVVAAAPALEGAIARVAAVAQRATIIRDANREIKAASEINMRTTREGETAVRLRSGDGREKDISPRRVKEFAPNNDPRAPRGALQKQKFEDAQPGSKGFKRDPTPTEQEILKKLQRGQRNEN